MLSRSMRVSAMLRLLGWGRTYQPLAERQATVGPLGARPADAAQDSVREAEGERLGPAPPLARRERRAIGERAVGGALVGNAEQVLDVVPGRATEDELAKVGGPHRTPPHARTPAPLGHHHHDRSSEGGDQERGLPGRRRAPYWMHDASLQAPVLETP